MIDKQKEYRIILNLRDAGCDEATIIKFIELLQGGNKKTALKLLDKHRSELLCAIHNGEKQIAYLDYFVYNLNKAK